MILMALVSFYSVADTSGIRPESDEPLYPKNYLMDTYKDTPYSDEAMECMIQNLYHEARGEGFPGMYAVAMVVMNRVQDKRYPNTVCGVIKQGKYNNNGQPVRHRCQFSWWCDGKSDTMHDTAAFDDALMVAKMVLLSSSYNGEKYKLIDITEGSTHYHTESVNPRWINDRGMTRIFQFGTHIFYRWG
jgi:spore germination cell wall hydrolase CwlJ-like protein